MVDYMFVLMLLIVLGCIWSLYCNIMTYHDRHNMACRYWSLYNPDYEKIVTPKQYEYLKAEGRRVDYSTHLWYRFTFRNWKQLYPLFFSTFKD